MEWFLYSKYISHKSSNTFEGGERGDLIERGAYLRGGGLLNLAKMISSSQRARIQTVENLSEKKLEFMQTKIKNKSGFPVGEQTILDQSTLSFTGMID